jgi:hypothetical protein
MNTIDKVKRKSSKASPKKKEKEKKKKKEKKNDRLTESFEEPPQSSTNPLHQNAPTPNAKEPAQPQGAYSATYTRTFPVKSSYAPLLKDAKKEKKWVAKCCKTSKPGLMWMAFYVVAYYLFKVLLIIETASVVFVSFRFVSFVLFENSFHLQVASFSSLVRLDRGRDYASARQYDHLDHRAGHADPDHVLVRSDLSLHCVFHLLPHTHFS